MAIEFLAAKLHPIRENDFKWESREEPARKDRTLFRMTGEEIRNAATEATYQYGMGRQN